MNLSMKPASVQNTVEANIICYCRLYNYRRAQVFPREKVRYPRNALVTRRKMNVLQDSKFMEMVEWSQTHKASCVEALARSKFKKE